MQLGTFFFDQLPDYFKQNDSYKDNNDKGLLERYLGIFGVELQQETVNKLESFLDQKDPITVNSELLSTIAYDLGSPVDLLGNEAVYREYLTQIISIYQVKGTTRSFKLLFALMGFDVTVTEIAPDDGHYDTGIIYDDNIRQPIYDLGCPTCSQYNLDFQTLTGLHTQLTNDLLSRILEGISFIQPINISLYQLTFHPETGSDIVYIDGVLQ